MLISTKGRYALRVVLDLLSTPGTGTFPSNPWQNGRMSLSSTWSPSSPSCKKAASRPASAARRGGYRLACPASELSVYEIVRLTEGSLAPSPAWRILTPPSAASAVAPASALPSPPQGLERRVVEYLSGVTVQDLLDGRALDQ